MKIITADGVEVSVSAEDIEKLSKYKWYLDANGYVFRREYLGKKNGRSNIKTVYLHREINNTPEGMLTDHKNGIKTDNRRENLRTATKKQNQRNQKSSTGKSKYKGVAWHTQAKKWSAQITVDYKKKHLGLFNNEIEAALAYNNAARINFGDFALLNEVYK